MSRALVGVFGAITVVSAVLSLAVTLLNAHFSCPTGFANFGDSLTDTGNLVDTFRFTGDAENSPYGESFFRKPAKRFCNGRLMPDFFSQAFKVPLLDSYFSVASFNYKSGINFANGGATAAFNPTAISPISVTPFQTSQFIRFKNSVFATQAEPGCSNFNRNLPQTSLYQKNPFSTWLYTITAGVNDVVLYPLEPVVPLSVVNATVVPNTVNEIVTAIMTLYATGAQQFLIFGLPAWGCNPLVITFLTNSGLPKDELGCIVAVNSVVHNFNSQLLSEIKVLRQNLTGANIAYFDYYSANIEILTHPTAYGFDPALTKTTCCGASGGWPFNYNPNVTCGNPAMGSNNCANPDQHVNWDGIHFTESVYRVIARFALNGVFTDGGPSYATLCNLDFSKFGSGVTFQEAYPSQTCNNLFT